MQSPSSKPPAWRSAVLRWGALALVLIGIAYLWSIRDQLDLDELNAYVRLYGYPAIFIITLASNASFILPIPSMAMVFTVSGYPELSPLWVGVVAGVGATLGELSGYAIGYGGQGVVENRALYDKLEGWMRRYGPLTLVVLAFVPNPVFDLAGVAAGALKMPVYEFLFWCLLGKIPKMVLTAYAGFYSIGWVLQLFGVS